MEKHIGIVLPHDLKSELVGFGRRYGYDITEPHIMLIPHEILTKAKRVDRNLQSFCLSQPPFKTAVGGPRLDLNEEFQAFYLTVIMGTINSIRDKLIKHLKLPAVGGTFRSRVALAEQKATDTQVLEQMLEEAKKLFSKPTQIDVDALGIYTRPDKDTSFTLSKLYSFTGR